MIVLVESPEGVKNFDDIIHVPGLAAAFLGLVNLSLAMGLKGNMGAPEVRAALLNMVHRAGKAGVPVGALGLDPAFGRELFDEGLDFLAYGIDTILMYQKCREVMQAVFGQESVYISFYADCKNRYEKGKELFGRVKTCKTAP